MTLNILVLEDEPDIRKTLEYNLSREGYKVISAASIEQAKTFIKSDTFSLFLLDLMLPDGSGLDLCKKLKGNSETESVPIIILTAKDDEIDKIVGLELGADDYVTKPFSVRELILRIKSVLKRGTLKKDIVEIERQFGGLGIRESRDCEAVHANWRSEPLVHVTGAAESHHDSALASARLHHQHHLTEDSLV